LRPDELEDVLNARPQDPRQTHARECPRCGALLDTYRLYRAETPLASPAEVADADARLEAAFERELEAGAWPVASAARESRPGRAVRSTPWWERLFHPAMRPAWGLAALALILASVLVWPRLRMPAGSGELRGGPSSGAGQVQIHAVTVTGSTLRIEWGAWPGAEGYVVHFYSGDLQELGPPTAARETTMVLDQSRLPFALASADSVLFRVYAQIGGDRVASSAARPIRER
jgi:hypothetical protein